MDVIFFALAFSAIMLIATKIILRYLDDEIRRRSGAKPKSGNADLD
jgi:hypothetical protein